jgi:hypothetical protein
MADPGRETLTRGTGMCDTLALEVRGLGDTEGVCAWVGVLGVLGGVDIAEAVGDSARCMREVGIASSSLSDIRLEDLKWSAGTGIWLGVLDRGRGLDAFGKPNDDVARDDGRLTPAGFTWVLGVDNVEFDGDHGLDDV